jgi:hypothetical protein
VAAGAPQGPGAGPVTIRAHHGRDNYMKGRRDYVDLGGLTQHHMVYLTRRPSDRERRRVLTVWFGHHGGRYAWRVYNQYKNRNL